MGIREQWLRAYSLARVASTSERESRCFAPKFDRAIEVAIYDYGDRLSGNAGRYLQYMRQKQRSLRVNGYWFGFGFKRGNLNCRCSMTATKKPAESDDRAGL